MSGADLAALSRWARAEHPEIAKELRKGLREAAKPILAAERDAVRGLKFSTTVVSKSRVLRRKQSRVVAGRGRGGGSGARRRAEMRGTTSMAEAVSTGRRLISARQAERNRAGAGLRESIARGMKITTSTRAGEMQVSVKTTSSQLPPDQRLLPRLVNYGRWRHPVFPAAGDGRKNWRWVYQSVDRHGWWWQSAEGEIPDAIVRMRGVASEIEKQLRAQAMIRARGHEFGEVV